MIVKTINYDWKVKTFQEVISYKKNTTFYKYPLKNKEVIEVNKNIRYINYTIFKSIYVMYCEEMHIKGKYIYNIFKFLLDNKEFFLNYINNSACTTIYLKINGLCFDLKYLTNKQAREKFDKKHCGWIVTAEYTIYINNEILSKEAKIQTILHECVHGLFFSLGNKKLYHNELVIDSVANILFHFIKNNKELVKILLTKKNSEIVDYIEQSSCKELIYKH